jgi:tetratricopeptide (TPR) repeat protein
MIIVVGDSSTGKTRACWEAIRAELPAWRVWHPLAPDRPLAVVEAIQAGLVTPETVIWLNEAQLYLDAGSAGERMAAILQELLTDPSRGPVLVGGSMWPQYWRALTATPAQPGAPDSHPAIRALLGQVIDVSVPGNFTGQQIARLATLIDTDLRLRVAAQASGGRITQFLAGAPELLRRYEHADPGAKAVLWAAMDARRLGHSLYLPEQLLEEAAAGYLDTEAWEQLPDEWFTAALNNLTALNRSMPGPFTRHRSRPGDPSPVRPMYRLADYLDQYGRTERRFTCPPTAFWRAAVHAGTSRDLVQLGHAAHNRGRYRHAARLYLQARQAGESGALCAIARIQGRLGDFGGAERSYLEAARSSREGNCDDPPTPWDMERIKFLRDMDMHRKAGTISLSEYIYQTADEGYPRKVEWIESRSVDLNALLAVRNLAEERESAGDRDSAERLYWQAVEAGDLTSLLPLGLMREAAGDSEGADKIFRQGISSGYFYLLCDLPKEREARGDRDGAERLYWQALNAGMDPRALTYLAFMQTKTGDHHASELMLRFGVTAEGTIDSPWNLVSLVSN